MINYVKPILAGLLVVWVNAAFALTAAEMNTAVGDAIIVADVTPEPDRNSIDLAKHSAGKAGPSMGEVTSGIVASQSMGTRMEPGTAAGLLIDTLIAPMTHDSRRHQYSVVYTKNCKVMKAYSTTKEADISGLVPGQIAHWIEPPSGKGNPLLAVLNDADGKPLPRIDSSHRCYAVFDAARKAEEAKRPGAAQ
ncbi:MAG: hypothetical protein NTY41_01135 [Proteobacteria bacterium]|nr:hypothetical protein [Pseudomonadota bacterium]